MSCSFSTDELHEKREQLNDRLDELEADLRSGAPGMGNVEEYEYTKRELQSVERILESRGELE